MERTESEIFGLARDSGAVADLEAEAALEVEGLQKVKGKDQVEPFEAPEVEPLPTTDGVIDLKIKPKPDAA